MIISIASDHAGFEQKQELVKHLHDEGYEVHDLGPNSDARVDYPDFAEAVAHEVASKKSDAGVLVCGTGIGMAMVANKVRGIRAANITTPKFAALAREHNNANIVTVSGRYCDIETNEAIVDTFLTTEFSGGRHEVRVEKIMAIEQAETAGLETTEEAEEIA